MDPIINQGVLKTSRRPSPTKPNDAVGFTSCLKCLGSYKISSIRHHVKGCTKRILNGERSVLALCRAVEGRIHETASAKLKEIFKFLTLDDVVLSIRFDWLVIAYGNKLAVMHRKLSQQKMIRSKLRRAGQLLVKIRSICLDVTDFASVFHPKCYDSLVAAVRQIGRLDPNTNLYGTPSTAADMLTETKAIGAILECEYIKQENTGKQTQTQNFLKLLKVDASSSLYKAIYDTQAKMHREKIDRIPSDADVKLFAEFLDRERKKYCSLVSLSQKFVYGDWLRLSELTLVSIIVFNRRRVGESENILETDYDGRDYLNEEVVSKLPVADKLSAKKYSLMTIQGKKGRDVPALIEQHIEKCLELMKTHRKAANVPVENEFLFGLPPTGIHPIRYLDACYIIRKFSNECGAKDPESLRGTTLRKHMASVCIWNDLDDNTVSEVADFMGHEEKIHRLHYRRNPKVRRIVKMSQLLEKAQGLNNDGDVVSPDVVNSDENTVVPEEEENTVAQEEEENTAAESMNANHKRKFIANTSDIEGNENSPDPKSKFFNK